MTFGCFPPTSTAESADRREAVSRVLDLVDAVRAWRGDKPTEMAVALLVVIEQLVADDQHAAATIARQCMISAHKLYPGERVLY